MLVGVPTRAHRRLSAFRIANAYSTELPFGQGSTCSAVIRITGTACSWMGWTTSFDAVVMIGPFATNPSEAER